LQACDPLLLEPGSRILETSSNAPIVIDRLTLRSSRATPSAPAEVIDATIERTTRTALVPACASDLCWVESTDGWNTGWKATIAGRTSEPPIASAAGRGTWVNTSRTAAVFRSEWTPQRLMWVGIAVSLLGTVLTLLVLASRRLRGRRLGRTIPDTATSTPSAVTNSRRLAGSAMAIGLMIAVFVHPIAGFVAAVVTVIEPLVERRERAIIDSVLVGLIALGYAYVIVQQTRYGTPTGFGWPGAYGKVHGVVLFSAVMYGARLTRDRPPSSGTISHL
jgi:hypothetical protein